MPSAVATTRGAAFAAVPVLLVIGVLSETRTFALDEPRRWVPDLAVGLVYGGIGLRLLGAPGRPRGAGALFLATGVAWFAGNLGGIAVQLYRGPLGNLLVAYPGARPRGRLPLAAVVAAYGASVAPIWQHEAAAVAYPVLLFGVALWRLHGADGTRRVLLRTAATAAAGLAVVAIAGAVARSEAGNAAVEPALAAFEVALSWAAIVLALPLAPRGADVADLVVELGEAPGPRLRAGLASALGDPELAIGYWTPEAQAYLDDAGRPVALPPPTGSRTTTHLEGDGAPLAVIVHDRASAETPHLARAVAKSARLVTRNAALRAEVARRLAEVAASRRRLLVAADEERRLLAARIDDGPERRLARLADVLADVPPAYGARAAELLDRTHMDLDALARGLHPRELTELGLAGALPLLAATAPLDVRVTADVGRLDAELEVTAYFVCAEALANVVKHAGARQAEVTAARRDGSLMVTIADDGVGGADPAGGSGLQGLIDRVEAVGGRLTVAGGAAGGTRVAAEFPLSDAPAC